jgi:predicted alpha/beta hydrolase family esterase
MQDGSFICHSFGGIALSQYMETVGHNEKTKIVLIAPATETTSAIDGFFTFLQLNQKVRKEL